MSRRPLFFRSLLLLSFAALAAVGRGQDVLDNVPNDALAFVVVRDLTTLQSQTARFSNPAEPSVIDLFPLRLVAAVVGNNRGLDQQGDLLFVARSSDRPLVESPLCVWLPVSDYGLFVRALGGNPEERITVVTLLGEDVLCARHGEKWALLVDAGERQHLEQTLAGGSNPPPRLAAWREWLKENSAAIAVFPTAASRKALREWAGATNDLPTSARSSIALEDLFGPPRSSDFTEATGLESFRRFLGGAMTTSPQMFQLALDADAFAVGLRLDGNALKAGLRMAWPQDPWRATEISGATAAPALHREGEFTFSGGGRFPAPFARAIAESAVRSSLAQMRDENPRTTFDPALVDQFIAACDAAAAQVAGASVIQLVGGEQEGVFTNHFLAVRVASAETFTKQIAETVRLWNELSASAQPSTKSEFEVQQVEIAGHKASQYTLDIAASEGLPDEPTLRQAMERLFGPDRKLHRFAVQFDEHTVLLAGATSDQVASAVRFLKDESPATWNATNVAISNHALPEQADWKLFLGPNGYTKWLKRTSLATHGDVIGAPPQQIFPPTPPLGFAGSFPAGELSIEFRVPEETLRAGHLYWVRETTRRRAGG